MSATTYTTHWNTNSIWLFDAMANAFYRSHWMLAPSKDEAAAVWSSASRDERQARYSAWRSCLGPVDVACILSVAEMRKRNE